MARSLRAFSTFHAVLLFSENRSINSVVNGVAIVLRVNNLSISVANRLHVTLKTKQHAVKVSAYKIFFYLKLNVPSFCCGPMPVLVSFYRVAFLQLSVLCFPPVLFNLVKYLMFYPMSLYATIDAACTSYFIYLV